MATILVVDDRPVNRELLVSLLTYQGHRLLEAADGAEALWVVRAERPELVVTDVLMPSMDGYEFARQLRADPATAPTRLIFYSARYDARELEGLAQAAGVAAFLAKPALPEDILRTVNQVLAAAPAPAPPGPLPETYQQEHLRLLMDKLARQVSESEPRPPGPGENQVKPKTAEPGRQPASAPVLYVEDEENDAFLLQMAFRNAGVAHPFRVLTDGSQAVDYLAGAGRFADRIQNPLPCLMILDLNLPRKSGIEVLEWIRQQPQFKSLPVLIYTSSAQEHDREKTSRLGASGYEVKSPRIAEMTAWVERIKDRWLAPVPRD